MNETEVIQSYPDSSINLYEGDENEERGNWSGKLDFLLSCIGFAVGLGNVWRFPYLCYKNGGGAFLIPYAIFLAFVGMPVFLIDLSLGQFTSNGPLTCWQFAPIFTGMGLCMTVMSFYVTIYYNVIIAYSIYYLFASMSYPLPWENYKNSWTTESDSNCSINTNNTCDSFNNQTKTMPSQEYFNNEVLGLTAGIWETGEIKWKLCLCLLASWVIVFLCIIRGIKSSGKVVYFTAIFPYVVLMILLVRGVTLKGALEGIKFYMIPEFEKLKDSQVWKDAANQIFFSLSVSSGGLITLASYNRFHTNTVRDTLIVTLCNCGTSVFAGFVIFSFLGNMALETGKKVSEVVDRGMGLAFVVYPASVTTMPISTLWSILFFIMLLTLGIDSQFTSLETVITAITDYFPKFRKYKTLVIGNICIVLFLCGIPLTTGGGTYWIMIMDSYCAGWAVLMIGLFEVIAIGWTYGRPGFKKDMRFVKDIEVMIKRKPSIWWRLNWQFTAPLLLMLTLVFAWVDYKPTSYNDIPFPVWADVVGWLMTLSGILWIPITIVYLAVTDKGPHSLLTKFYNLTLPTYRWGPALVKHRLEFAEHLEDKSNFYVDPENRIRYSEYVNPKTAENPAFSNDNLDKPTTYSNTDEPTVVSML